MRKRLILLCSFLILTVMVAGMALSCSQPATTSPAASPAAKKVTLKFGTTAATSSAFAWAAAFARVATKYNPGVIDVLPLESGATYDNFMRMQEGVFDIGGWAYDAAVEMQTGTGYFQGKPWKELRVMITRVGQVNVQVLYVPKASGIKGLTDFIGTGKQIYLGIPGSGTYQFFERAFETNGGVDKAKIFKGSLTDATTAYQEGRVLGLAKGHVGFDKFDTSMQEIHLTKPVIEVGLTKAQMDNVKAKYPQYTPVYYPKGVNPLDKEIGDFWTQCMISSIFATSKVPEEIGYLMTKAVVEHVDEMVAVDAATSKDPIRDLLKFLDGAGLTPETAVPFHAGTVRYAKEKGIQIPDYMIPPEYKAK